jgi:hypothetical protein
VENVSCRARETVFRRSRRAHRCAFAVVRLAFVVLTLAGAARASSFTWSAPDGCPSEASVRALLERELGAESAASSGLSFDALVSKRAGALELLLKARGPDGAAQERRIRASTCDALVDALVAAVSLARQALETPSSPEPRAAESRREPKPESVPPSSIPRAATRAAPAANAGTPLQPIVALGALLDVGALPSVAFGVEALIGLEWPGFDLSALGALTTRQQADIDGGAAAFDLAFGGVSACYSPTRSTWELAGCLKGEAGRIRGMGVGVENAREGSALWLAIVPAARLAFRPPPRRWGLVVQVGAVVPLTRRSFELTEVGIVHQPAPIGLRAMAGIELGFR